MEIYASFFFLSSLLCFLLGALQLFRWPVFHTSFHPPVYLSRFQHWRVELTRFCLGILRQWTSTFF